MRRRQGPWGPAASCWCVTHPGCMVHSTAPTTPLQRAQMLPMEDAPSPAQGLCAAPEPGLAKREEAVKGTGVATPAGTIAGVHTASSCLHMVVSVPCPLWVGVDPGAEARLFLGSPTSQSPAPGSPKGREGRRAEEYLPTHDHGEVPRTTNLTLAGLHPPTGVCLCKKVEKATNVENLDSFPLKRREKTLNSPAPLRKSIPGEIPSLFPQNQHV